MHAHDEEAIRLCQQGNNQGLDSLVHRYQLQAIRTAYLILGDRVTAEDVVQESFVRAWNSIKSFDPRAAFAPWFMRTVVNVAHTHQRTLTSVADKTRPPNESMIGF